MPDFYDLWSAGSVGTTTGALAASLQARTTPGVLYGADGWTTESATVYICFFDSAAAVANANPPAVWPKHIVEVDKPGNGNFGITEPPTGENFKNGIWVGVSTTALPNFTLSTNSDTHINVQHGPIFGSGQP